MVTDRISNLYAFKPKPLPPLDEAALAAFVEKIEKGHGEGDCWRWTGAFDHNGFGVFHLPRRCRTADSPVRVLAKRVAGIMLGGLPDDGRHFTQTCRHYWCVAPSHLSIATAEDLEKELTDRWGRVTRELSRLRREDGHYCSMRANQSAPPQEMIEKFWSLVERGGEDECWPWLGPTATPSRSGGQPFPTLRYGYENWVATRFAWQWAVEPPRPSNRYRIAACPLNRLCVNPEHLSIKKPKVVASMKGAV